ncbi:Uncharacterised protein [Raoultella terrigena]|uniref:Pilus assembly protein E-set like domain-containing protein n=1 Tax=Raoultella terrigena TaxID=577 RepID=A0A4U9D497_RAOTE|nr:Uncharacterised protein [Raoultella terrigena]
MTAISAGKIYGASWGNQASSTVFDNSQSATPIIAFLPSAGEVHLSRDGRLLSVQNFMMGNHEVDTRGLPYGIYDVNVEVVVNGRVVSKRTQRVNKLFTRGRRRRRAFGLAGLGRKLPYGPLVRGRQKDAARQRELAGRGFGNGLAGRLQLGRHRLRLR